MERESAECERAAAIRSISGRFPVTRSTPASYPAHKKIGLTQSYQSQQSFPVPFPLSFFAFFQFGKRDEETAKPILLS
jgi:hypothetical protein